MKVKRPKRKFNRDASNYSRRKYEREANQVARDYVDIKPCRDCGHPHITIMCCTFCGSVDP